MHTSLSVPWCVQAPITHLEGRVCLCVSACGPCSRGELCPCTCHTSVQVRVCVSAGVSVYVVGQGAVSRSTRQDSVPLLCRKLTLGSSPEPGIRDLSQEARSSAPVPACASGSFPTKWGPHPPQRPFREEETTVL